MSGYPVSIPFKRESVSKESEHAIAAMRCDAFQFPSNGKVYPKAANYGKGINPDASFNSLQTGKCIQR